MILFILITQLASAGAITAEDARALASQKPTPKYDVEIRKAALKGDTYVEFSVQCHTLRVLQIRGFELNNQGCAPPEYGGRCSCVVKW